MKFKPDYDPVDGKSVGKNTLAQAGINTAMLAPKPMGHLTCGWAMVSGGGTMPSIDWRKSAQQRDHRLYREMQSRTRDTKHGTPVAKEFKDAGRLHPGLDMKLNFAPTNSIQKVIEEIDSTGVLTEESKVSICSQGTSTKAVEPRKKSVEQQKRNRMPRRHSRKEKASAQLKTPSTHAKSPHELSLGNTEAGSDSDSASEAMEFGAEMLLDTISNINEGHGNNLGFEEITRGKEKDN